MLGFCSGGYYGSSNVEFEVGDPIMEVSGPRELRFFPGTARGCAYKGFKYGDESGARALKVNVNPNFMDIDQSVQYYNGGAVFVDAAKYDNVTVLAEYKDPVEVDTKGHAAVVHCTFGRGAVILTGTHPEYVPELMHGSQDKSYVDLVEELRTHDDSRKKFLRACLLKLGLKVNDDEMVRPRLTPLFLSSPTPGAVSKIVNNIVKEIGVEDGLVKCEKDTFRLHVDEFDTSSHMDKQEHLEDPDSATKELIALTNSLPDRKLTSYFDISAYFRFLHQLNGSLDNKAGSILIYGEVVTSTSVMPNSNLSLLRQLPSGLVLAANVQVSGRGRGGNLWINPYGVLASSLILELPVNYHHAPVVFVQYLTALSVVESLKTLPGYEELPIRIKWPNDVYVLKPEYFGKKLTPDEAEPAWVKISGILVNTNVLDNNYKCIVGTGINLSNSAPTTSINSTITAWNTFTGGALAHISSEQLLASYMHQMDILFNRFKQLGFKSLLPLYYKHWLHTDQVVRLQDHGFTRAKITGITDDFGLLVAQEVGLDDRATGVKYHLQPDGNSFDMFNNLISKKA